VGSISDGDSGASVQKKANLLSQEGGNQEEGRR